MDAAILCDTLQAILPDRMIEAAAMEHGVIARQRKLEIVKLVRALVLNAGSDDSGTLADAFRRYRGEATETVVRGAFYDWLDEEMAVLMECLLEHAMQYANSLPVHLPGILGTVDDWRIFDSETVTLRNALAEDYPGSGSLAAVKVHKELSVGRGCMTYCHFGPAREHDAPHLEVDERYRDQGLLVDLGYASLKFIGSCKLHGAKYIIRLKNNWKAQVERIDRGEVQAALVPGTDLDMLIEDEVIVLGGRCVDAAVTLGQGKKAVSARLVMIPGPDGYLSYLTNLARGTHGPHQVGELYRVRWEIESDNKLDKSGGRLDQIRATTESSVRILLCAALLHSMVVDVLIHRDNLDRAECQEVRRAPLHRLALAYALRLRHRELLVALSCPGRAHKHWSRLADLLSAEGRDPNWRHRPSVLDRLLGLTAPRGRPRKKKRRDCPRSAAPYRTTKPRRAIAMS
ncbi:MAG: IS4 family transposase [Candidatus Coatesbacteria bacterium]|nr:MAG: IS4 family transposase [Candidatus Coatesbacteria bacterium]